MKQDLDGLDTGRLTLWPFSPGSPGSPSKPLSPCTSTHRCHYIATDRVRPGCGGGGSCRNDIRYLASWLARHSTCTVSSRSALKQKKERKKETALLILRLVYWSLLTFKNVTFHATVLLRDLSSQKHHCWTSLSSSAQEQLSGLYPRSQLAHESSLPYWFAHDWFMFISNQLGRNV